MPGIAISLVLTAIIGYIWGSLPSGYWMGKLLKGKDFDIRDYGSHKTGATNVQRTMGNVPALIVLLLDLSKGLGPTAIATFVPFFNGAGWGPTVAGLAALLGHIYPIFLSFRGGRGVSTGGGALLFISPLSFAITFVVTIGTIITSRYVSLGSVLGCVSSIVCGVIFFLVGLINPHFFGLVTLAQLVFLIIAPSLVIYFHSDNIKRLLAGTERKIGQKVNVEAEAAGTPGHTVRNSISNI